MKRIATLTLLALALAHLPARSSQIEAMDLRAATAGAPLVITGYVASRKLVQDSPGITEYEATVIVTGVLRGKPGLAKIRLRLRTGLVFFDRLVEPGDSGVFLLKPTEKGAYEAEYPGSFALFQPGTVKKP